MLPGLLPTNSGYLGGSDVAPPCLRCHSQRAPGRACHIPLGLMVTYPHPSNAAVTAVMKANRRRDTGPEMRLRSELHARGYRYRCDYSVGIGCDRVRVDIAFPSRKIAVFVDGCFWHSCEVHGNAPQMNQSYWGPKLARNRDRDRRVDERLAAAGWKVVRIWEHTGSREAADIVLEAMQ